MKRSAHEVAALAWLAVGLAAPGRAAADDWPQWRGPGRDGVWREAGVLDKLPTGRIKLAWRAPISSGYSGPTVADGRVYVTDRLARPRESERVHCFDARTGRPLWSRAYAAPYRRVSYTAGPRASVSVDDGRAYALGTMGHFHCLDANDGRVLWRRNLAADYQARVPVWGIAAAPLVDGERVIVQIGGADGACVVALDKKTGKETWRALDDRASYSAPVIIRQGETRVLVCWTGDSVAGLDPVTGRVHWRWGFKPSRMIINVPTPVVQGERLFVTAFYDGSLMLRLLSAPPRVEKLWRRRGRSERDTDALHAMIATPIFQGDHVYGVDSYGQLRCLDARTGDRVWEDLTATPKARWSNIHMVRNGERIWMLNERGELILCTLSPKGFHEIGRAKLIDPTTEQLRQRGGVCWAHPAYARKHVFARNDRELICADLSAGGPNAR